MGYLSFSGPDGVLLFHLPGRHPEYNSIVITTNGWVCTFCNAKMIAALLDRLTLCDDILETGNDNFRFKAKSAVARTDRAARPQYPKASRCASGERRLRTVTGGGRPRLPVMIARAAAK
jgi:hypothetical protein